MEHLLNPEDFSQISASTFSTGVFNNHNNSDLTVSGMAALSAVGHQR